MPLPGPILERVSDTGNNERCSGVQFPYGRAGVRSSRGSRATYLARTGHAARISSASVDLKWAAWDIDVERRFPLAAPNKGAGYAGHHHVQIGRLVHLAVKAD